MAEKTQMITGKVRFSYLHVFEPRKQQSGAERYSATLLIPKKDKKTLAKIKAAIAEAKSVYQARNGKSAENFASTMHDGDGAKPKGDPYGPECEGKYVLAVSSKDKPQIVDSDKMPITEKKGLYSGCYGRAVIRFYAFENSGNRGVTAELLGLMKLYDGEPLGGGIVTDEVWDEPYDDIEEEEDFDPLS